jgi:hypothetical protein
VTTISPRCPPASTRCARSPPGATTAGRVTAVADGASGKAAISIDRLGRARITPSQEAEPWLRAPSVGELRQPMGDDRDRQTWWPTCCCALRPVLTSTCCRWKASALQSTPSATTSPRASSDGRARGRVNRGERADDRGGHDHRTGDRRKEGDGGQGAAQVQRRAGVAGARRKHQRAAGDLRRAGADLHTPQKDDAREAHEERDKGGFRPRARAAPGAGRARR